MGGVGAQVYVGDCQFLKTQLFSMRIYLVSYTRLVPAKRGVRQVVVGGVDD